MNNSRLVHYIDLSITVNGYINTINNLINSKNIEVAYFHYRVIMNFLMHDYYKTERLTFKAYVYFINRIHKSINIEKRVKYDN